VARASDIACSDPPTGGLFIPPSNRPHYASCPSIRLSLTYIIDALQLCCRCLLHGCRPSLSVVVCNRYIVAKR